VDEIIASSFEKKLAQMEAYGEYLWNLIHEKLQPLRNTIKEEFENTEEYKSTKKNEEIIRIYTETKKEFENKYCKATYDYCYDVFGVLRNEEYLKNLETVYKTRQQYTRNSSYSGNSYGRLRRQ
jgi:transcription termination factor Rho